MEEMRIQKQISIYMTNKKLCEFNDKLKLAPVDYYAHLHAQGEKQGDGIMINGIRKTRCLHRRQRRKL